MFDMSFMLFKSYLILLERRKMEILHDDECLEYCGGAKISMGLGIAISALGAFILGLIDGISNPKKCNAR